MDPHITDKLQTGPRGWREKLNNGLRAVDWCVAEIRKLRKKAAVAAALGPAAARRHPFEIYAATYLGEGEPRVAVEIDSWLMASPRLNSRITITGLGESGNGFAVGDGSLIYLRVNLTVDPFTAAIFAGEPWEFFDSPVSFLTPEDPENKTQEYAYVLLGYVAADDPDYPDRSTMSDGESGTLAIVQCTRDHLVLCRTCFEGDTVWMPFPYFAPGPE